MLLKDCVLVSRTVLIIYTQTILNMAQVIFSIVFQLLLIVCYVMDIHLPVFLHAAVIPVPKNAKQICPTHAIIEPLHYQAFLVKSWIK